MRRLIGLAAGACLIPSIALAQGGLEVKGGAGVSTADMAAAISTATAGLDTTTARQAAISALVIPPVTDLGTFTVATLPGVTGTTNTCSSTNAKKTAWASDLMGLAGGDRVVCDGVNWKPVRPLAVSQVAVANMTVQPMLNASTIVVTGALGIGLTNAVTLGTNYVFGSAHARVVNKVTGLGTINVTIAGVNINLPILGSGSWADFDYDAVTCSCWVKTASGTL